MRVEVKKVGVSRGIRERVVYQSHALRFAASGDALHKGFEALGAAKCIGILRSGNERSGHCNPLHWSGSKLFGPKRKFVRVVALDGAAYSSAVPPADSVASPGHDIGALRVRANAPAAVLGAVRLLDLGGARPRAFVAARVRAGAAVASLGPNADEHATALSIAALVAGF